MDNKLLDKNNIKLTKKILLKYKLCDSCLGRLFAKIGKGQLNKTRGRNLRKATGLKKIQDNNCWLCEGLILEIPDFADIVKEKLSDYEFNSFLIGSKLGGDILQREEELINFSKSKFSEPIKMEINREVGKILEKELKTTVSFEKPDITAIIDASFNIVDLQITSLYVYGRYKKYKRDIPQTKWPCNICRGIGCRSCNFSGRLYENSVEELIGKRFLEITEAKEESFHGCGREDIDALMLGNGRPFVLEIKNPVKRKISFKKIQKEINESNKEIVEVNNLRFSNKEEIIRLKNAEYNKTYRILIECEKQIKKEKLKEVALLLPGTTIRQFTPTRVAHRRANMVREKKIYDCKIESIEGTIARLVLEAQSGTYIKELVSGDDQRTQPNISDMIENPCKVLQLDVIEIKGE